MAATWAILGWNWVAAAQDDAAAARKQWREVADQMRPRPPKLAGLPNEAEAEVLAFMDFPTQHRAGIFCNEAAVVRLIGALPLEQNDE